MSNRTNTLYRNGVQQFTKIPPLAKGGWGDFPINSFMYYVVIIVVFLCATTAPAADIYCFDDGETRYFTNTPGPGRTKVRLPLAGLKKQKAYGYKSMPVSYKTTYEPVIASAGKLYDVDPDIIRAVIKAESNYNERAVSPKGALGLMQLMPGTARDMGVGDVFDPEQNIHGGVRYLSELLGALNQDLPLALAAYNAGPARVFVQKKIPPIRETRSYVERVLGLYRNLKERNTL